MIDDAQIDTLADCRNGGTMLFRFGTNCKACPSKCKEEMPNQNNSDKR